ncbi:MAG: glycine cleavage system protein H [Desulfacinum sp.]|jgi:glycine cleavage system H lipoate-binding protein|nr:glycine cleavage system protein H [Desulfacinum sp.]
MEKKSKVHGFNFVQEECIWMRSGIVAFKRCENAFDCTTCAFDKAMSAAIRSGREKAGRKVRPFREESKERSYMERVCRHMLTGRVAVRKCGNDFRCDVCEFDQMLEDVDAIHPMGAVPIVTVAGYRYSDSYYYHLGHAWARVEYGGRVRVGLDDFGWKLVGRADVVEVPGPGNRVRQEKEGFTLHRESHTARVLSPVDGTVLAVNVDSLHDPRLAHDDPYVNGWLYLVEPEALKKNLEPLYFGEMGKEWLYGEAERLLQIVLGDAAAMAATGSPPVDDVYGQVPEVGWDRLVREFFRT